MIQPYFETRASLPTATQSVAADIARHLQSRQYLGTAVVVCDHPLATLSAARKQWLRLARNLQKQRASTLNAEEILRFTHSIMHMQRLRFLAKPPSQFAEAEIYFAQPETITHIPRNCFSFYITSAPNSQALEQWLSFLPASALVVTYDDSSNLEALGLRPKSQIEEKLLRSWQRLHLFLRSQDIEVERLVATYGPRFEAMDQALDILLGVSTEFLHQAALFQHTMDLCQPLRGAAAQQHRLFEVITRLAYRVQTLTPGTFGSYLGKSFGEAEAGSYFLRDAAPESDELLDDDIFITFGPSGDSPNYTLPNLQ